MNKLKQMLDNSYSIEGEYSVCLVMDLMDGMIPINVFVVETPTEYSHCGAYSIWSGIQKQIQRHPSKSVLSLQVV